MQLGVNLCLLRQKNNHVFACCPVIIAMVEGFAYDFCYIYFWSHRCEYKKHSAR